MHTLSNAGKEYNIHLSMLCNSSLNCLGVGTIHNINLFSILKVMK